MSRNIVGDLSSGNKIDAGEYTGRESCCGDWGINGKPFYAEAVEYFYSPTKPAFPYIQGMKKFSQF